MPGGFPEIAIQAAEKLNGVVVPSPAQVVGQLPEPFERGRQRRDDIEHVDGLHTASIRYRVSGSGYRITGGRGQGSGARGQGVPRPGDGSLSRVWSCHSWGFKLLCFNVLRWWSEIGRRIWGHFFARCVSRRGPGGTPSG